MPPVGYVGSLTIKSTQPSVSLKEVFETVEIARTLGSPVKAAETAAASGQGSDNGRDKA